VAEAGGGTVDLRRLIAPYQRRGVQVSAPADAVPLPYEVADEVASAVGAALDNVAQHAGPQARAWVLVEDEGGDVLVTVRDDGVGMPEGRLDEAARSGRLGVAQSVCGRVRDLGGSVQVTSSPGAGTEVEMRVPRRVSA
jgi:signal transduction histidine kinase